MSIVTFQNELKYKNENELYLLNVSFKEMLSIFRRSSFIVVINQYFSYYENAQ